MNFRAWIKKDKKMVGVKLIGGGYLWDSNTWIDKKTDRMETAHEIGITCEVMRGTGVKVSNGEAYEGDIIRVIGGDIKWQVCYDRWGIPALARVDYPMGTDFKEMEMVAQVPPKKLRIIGNIYENEELLK